MCFYVKRRGVSESVMGDVRAGGWREKKEMPCVLSPTLLSQQRTASAGSGVCLLLTSASRCPWHLLPISVSGPPRLPAAEDSWHCTFNLANVQIEDRTKPIGFFLN